MDNSFNMKNYDLSNISSKNNLFLEVTQLKYILI